MALPDIVNYRANLTASEFPFLSEFQGRSVILPGIDQDGGIPQAYYMHNVLPTQRGLTSVGYTNIINAPADQDGTFAQIFSIRDSDENVGYFGRTLSGRNYVFVNPTLGWLRTTDVSLTTGNIVSSAYINGKTYICFGGTGTYEYDFGTNTLTPVTLTGTNPLLVLGITASNGYMLAWTTDQVVWSSLIDPTDFVPSLITGAGGGQIQTIKGSIVILAPNNAGFSVYTKRNVVSAQYTGNTAFPFAFKEIQGAGGIPNATLISFDGNSTNHVAYTTAGLQQISTTASQIIHPQLTDFVAGSQFEDYDEGSGEFISIPLASPLRKQLAVIANRYLVFSYGTVEFTHALVFDMALNRWGKLKQQHVDCFEYIYPSSDVVDAPKRSIGFLRADGSIVVVVSSYDTAGSNGVVLLGKYQLDRNRLCSLQEMTIEAIRYGENLEVLFYKTLDGITLQPNIPYLSQSAMTYRKYTGNAVGLNHSVLITGAFHLTSLQFKFIDEGEA